MREARRACARRASRVPVRTGGRSLEDLGDATGADGPTTLTDGEAEALLHRDRLDEADGHLGVVTGHDHLGALGQLDDTGDVRGAEVELRTVVRVERVVTPALVLVEDVDLGLELGVRGDGARLHDDLAALDLLALGAAEQEPDVLAGLGGVEELAEHLDAGDRGLDRLVLDADDLDLVVDVQGAALDTAGHDGAAAGDREDVLDRHEERLVDVALRGGDVLVDGVHELLDGLDPLRVTLEGLERGDAHDGGVVTGEVLAGEQVADLDLDELEDLLVVDHVGLVQGDRKSVV